MIYFICSYSNFKKSSLLEEIKKNGYKIKNLDFKNFEQFIKLKKNPSSENFREMEILLLMICKAIINETKNEEIVFTKFSPLKVYTYTQTLLTQEFIKKEDANIILKYLNEINEILKKKSYRYIFIESMINNETNKFEKKNNENYVKANLKYNTHIIYDYFYKDGEIFKLPNKILAGKLIDELSLNKI